MKDSKGSYGGKMMDNGKGMNSYKSNPMSKASQVKAGCGPGLNADQKKANRLLQDAQRQVDSQRGETGM